MNRNDANRILVALIESIPEDGLPEGYLAAAVPDYKIPLDLAVAGGLFKRDGFVVLRGPRFDAVRASLADFKRSAT